MVAAAGWLWKNAWVVSGVAAPVRLAPGPVPPGKTLRGEEFLDWDAARGALVLRANMGGPMASHEISLPGWPRGMAAHIRFSGEAREIVPGAEDWHDGRVMVIWREDDGKIMQPHYGLLGAKGSGRFDFEYVAVLNQPGQASVFLQHAGASGEFEIDGMEITPVGLRRWVPWATGTLLGAVGIWWAALFRRITGRKGPWRPLGAAALALGAVWTLVLPGPWEPLRPLGGSFVFRQSPPAMPTDGVVKAPATPSVAPSAPAPASSPVTLAAAPPPSSSPTAVAPVETPDRSPGLSVPGAMERGWFWETYRWVKMRARSLLHVGVFAILTLAFVTLLGSNRGWIPVALLGGASEAMQTLFGFGFGWEDAGDLAVNALGIGTGLLAAAAWRKWRAGRVCPLTSRPCQGAPPESS